MTMKSPKDLGLTLCVFCGSWVRPPHECTAQKVFERIQANYASDSQG